MSEYAEARAAQWWSCPNTPPCPHGQVLHDIEEFLGDGTDTCGAEGCECRGPNAAPASFAAGGADGGAGRG